MLMRFVPAVLLLLLNGLFLQAQYPVIKEGHRGCRGLMPENTIPAMKKALDLGVDVLEMDVLISQDSQVLVSHDPYFSADLSLKPTGEPVTRAEEKYLILYAMHYAEIRKYDVGSKHNEAFPRQQNFPAYKPLLSELIDSVDQYAKSKGMPLPSFNIEIKSEAPNDNIYHPAPPAFVRLVMDVCKSRNILNRLVIQSFDIRPLRLMHQQYPDVKLSYLTANNKTAEENLGVLGFNPAWYSPLYGTVNTKMVQYCHEKRIKLVPWTVNTKEEISALGRMGIEAIITDYPDLFQEQ